MKYSTSAAALALAAIPLATAQTFSDCNPIERTDCPTKAGLNAAEYFVDFTKGAPVGWTVTSNALEYGPEGAKFSIKAIGEGPTIQTDWHILGGYVEVVLKAAPGAGVVSSMVLQSDVLDEIDWEMIGSDTAQVQSNYFGKGNTTVYDRGRYHPVPPPQQTFIKYAVNWTQESTVFLLNDEPIRTLNFAEANGGANYPQTPMNIRLGNWIAGTPGNSQGTIDWAGGLVDLSQGPFDMYVQSARIINYNPAASYKYTDQSGSWASVQPSQEPPQKGTVGTGSSGPGVPAPAPDASTPMPSAPADGSSGYPGSSEGQAPVDGQAPGTPNTISIITGGYGGGAAPAATAPCSSSVIAANGSSTITISAGAAASSGGYSGGSYSNPFPQGGPGSYNGTAPTVTILTDTSILSRSPSTLTTAGSSAQSFGLGPTRATSAQSGGPAQVTTNAAPRSLHADGIVGLFALAFGFALM